MDNIILLTNKIYGESIFENLIKSNLPYKFIFIKNKNKFTLRKIQKLKPKYIFIPFWSSIISRSIYSNYTCINFHISDLPFGRGGSPLQNLIIKNFSKTKISAFKCNDILDGGDIYLKKNLNLKGSAEKILKNSSKIIFEMICEILKKNILPKPQKGKVFKFKRREPNQSDLKNIKDLKIMYNMIRMLDAEEYPKSYLETKHFKFELTNAKLYKKELIASVKIKKK